MYIPSYLPCFKCFTGPDIWRDYDGRVIADCGCGHISVAVDSTNHSEDSFDDDEMKRIAREWNSIIIYKFYDKPLR